MRGFFMILNRKMVFISFLIILLFSSAMIVSAADDNQSVMADVNSMEIPDEIHVSVGGNDDSGNGSLESPYNSISHAIGVAKNNSKIVLDGGTYKGRLNTNCEINKYLTIESTSNNVIIDGENKNFFFKINKESSLILNNINFINGYTDSYKQLGVINNQGKLTINNASFNSMGSVMSTFFNSGELIINSSTILNSKSENMAQGITNLGNCTVSNSQFNDKLTTCPTIYNYKNINIYDSKFYSLVSNKDYDEDNYQSGTISIKNSNIYNVFLQDIDCNMSDSNFTGQVTLMYVNAYIGGCGFNPDLSMNQLSVSDSNVTIIHSIFTSHISSSYSNLNITYSAILNKISGNGNPGYLYAPYNWWGINSGPLYEYFKNNYIKYWAILEFEIEDGNNSVGTDSKFVASLNKWSDGNSTFDFKNDEYLPNLDAKFESQNGKFTYSQSTFNRIFENYLENNTLDCNVYCVVNNQRLSIAIGNGSSNSSCYVALWGYDGEGYGSRENPFKTLKYAVEKAGNGNTIYVLEGNYTSEANSNILIIKNITLIGLGNVTLFRTNHKSMFQVHEWGNLIVKNIRFTTKSKSNSNNIFIVNGGKLSLNSCTFSQLNSALILTYSGIESRGVVEITDSSFREIEGSIAIGSAMIYVYNSLFEKISSYSKIDGQKEDYNYLFFASGSIEIYNSLFRQNNLGIVDLHQTTFSISTMLGENHDDYSRYAYVENSTFIDNDFKDNFDSSSRDLIGLNIYDDFDIFNGYLINCSFINNKGKLVAATNINSSLFYNNIGKYFIANSLIKASTICNSIFDSNFNQYRDSNHGFSGEGIASADLILNSTFINNAAARGGAVSYTKEVHYCVFVNNTAIYGGNNIYSYSGDVDYSSNWWGDNQKPKNDNIYIFLGNLKLDNWIVMSLESLSSVVVEASLNKLMDSDGNVLPLNYIIPVRQVYFEMDGGNISPRFDYLSNNRAQANLTYDLEDNDYKVFAKIDNQIMDVDVRNGKTQILIEDCIIKGKNNNFGIDLINVNGYKISNQTLIVEINDENNQTQSFSLLSDDDGHAYFYIDFPIGKYDVTVNYFGNGYFEKSNASAKMEILSSSSRIVTYNATYYGKNNLFYAIVYGENGEKLVDSTVTFTISNSNGILGTISGNTDSYGRVEAVLNLEVGQYDIKADFAGDLWYLPSSSNASITVRPVNSTFILPNVTLYGEGNEYNIILKDAYGTLIRGENIIVTVSQENLTDTFKIQTDEFGIGRLTINYLPGTYVIKANYLGDNIYGSARASAVIKVERILTVLSGFHHCTIPSNGVYSVILSDIYGHRINNETVILNCYKGKLIKTYSAITDANGEASFIIGLDEGTYLSTIDYSGNSWYDETTTAATIIVSKDAKLDSIYINSSDFVQYYGENKYFIIHFNDSNAYSQYGKLITVTISSESWHQSYEAYTDVFGLATLQIKLNPGEYNITYKYSNPYYNIFGNGTNKITVYKMPVTILSYDIIMKRDETRVYEVALRDVNNNPIRNMQVNIQVNRNDYVVTTNDKGIAKLPINLNLGEYEITSYVNDPNYIYAVSSSRIIVVDSNITSSKIMARDMDVYDNESINFTVELQDLIGNGIGSSEISIEICSFDGESIGNMVGSTNGNGKFTFNFLLESGKYLIYTKYGGNSLYLSSNSVNIINVESSDNLIKTSMFCGENNIIQSQNYYIVLADINGTLLKDKEIMFHVGNNTYSTFTDDNGKAYLNLNSTADVYSIKAVFLGDNEYKQCSILTKIYLSGQLTKLIAQKLVKYYRNGTQFHARLINENGNPLYNKTITVVLENNSYNCTSDENGWISLKIDLKPGIYDVECYYYGQADNENSFDSTTIEVLSTVIGENEIKFYGQYPYFTVKFLDGGGKGIANTLFVIAIDGNKFVTTTNSEGEFYLDSNLECGEHIISVINPYDGLSASYKLTIKPTIFTNSLVKVLGDGQYYVAKFLDENGSALKNKNVDVIIKGSKTNKLTDDNGEIKLAMELTPNNYLVTVINPISGEYIEKTIKVLHPICENKNLIMYFTGGNSFKVRILDIGGKIAGSGKVVKFIIAGKTYIKKTDKNGYASLKINLLPKTYTIISEYKGYKVSNKIVVKPILTAKNISKKKTKYIKFSAKLVDSKGKPAAGKKITFKIKNQKFTVKTNSKGIASINLKLKVGKYSIISTYGKYKIKNSIKIRK